MTHEVLTSNVLIRQQLDRHRRWIESRIDTTLADAVIFQTQLNLPQIGVEKVLGCTVKDDITARDLSRLRSLVVRAEIPETLAPLLNVSKAQTGCSLMQLLQGRGHLRHRLDWQDCPVALTLDAPAVTVVVMHVYLHHGLNSSHAEKETVLVARRDLAGQVFSLLDDLGRSTRTPHLQTMNGSSREVARCDWDQLTLSSATRTLLRAQARARS